jgi:hypothetical protein
MVSQVANLGKQSSAAAAPWGMVSPEISTPLASILKWVSVVTVEKPTCGINRDKLSE